MITKEPKKILCFDYLKISSLTLNILFEPFFGILESVFNAFRDKKRVRERILLAQAGK